MALRTRYQSLKKSKRYIENVEKVQSARKHF